MRSFKLYTCYLVVCLSLILHTARAQRFPFFNFTIDNGLIQSQVTCMTQDPSGNLWIGTLGGISRFDGMKFASYTVSDGLLSNTIYDLCFSNNGKLVISCAGGLQQFDGRSFRTIIKTQQNKRFNARLSHAGNHGEVWYMLDGKVYTTAHPEQALDLPLPSGYNIKTIAGKGDVLYVAADNSRLYCLNSGGTVVRDSALSDDPALGIIRVFEDSRHKVWLLCNKGLYYKNGHNILPYTWHHQPLITAPLLSAAEDRNGHLWLGTLSGAFRIRDSVVSYFNQKNGLSNNIVYDVLTDKEGNVWLSTDGQGIFRYSGGPFISVDESFGLPDKQVTGITGDDKGNIYFGTYSGKLVTYRLGGTIQRIHDEALNHAMIFGMVMQDNRKLWIATRAQGLFTYEAGICRQFPLEAISPVSHTITALYQDSQQRIWVGLLKDMCYISKDKPVLISLNDAGVNGFLEIGPDSLLIATTNGFMLYHDNVCRPWLKGSAIDSVGVQCMAADSGFIYIGSAEHGIIRYNFYDNTAAVISRRDGLSSDFIYNLLPDHNGNIWAGTGHGICRIRFDRNGKAFITCYDKANGVLGLESNGNAAYRSPDGYLWFGTTEGVSCYIPAARTSVARPVSIVLESVKLFGGKDIDTMYYRSTTGWYHIPVGLSLPYRYNNISFSFQAITLSPADHILYRYRLSGADTSWSVWSKESSINFSALDPGNYTLSVECSANGAERAQASLKYLFTIRTPFHKSVWFIITVFGAAILFGVYLQYTANRRKLRRQKREELLRRDEQNRVRERTAEDFHDEVGNKLTRINILTNVLKTKVGQLNADADRIIGQIQDNTQQLYSGTRDILWSLQPANDNFYEITNHVRDLATELFSDTDIPFTLSGNMTELREYKMPLDKSRNYIMIWKEALNNALKYARPRQVLLQVQKLPDGSVQVRLVDDGKGFNLIAATGKGNGLRNMKARAERLNGTIVIHAAEGKGTTITLTLPPNK